jgi:Bacterial Ig domain
MLKTKLVTSLSSIVLFTLFFACKKDSPTTPDTTPPQVQITSPATGNVLTEPVNIQISVIDNSEINSILIKLDGDTLSKLTDKPYTAFWNVGYWADGQNHTIIAIAEDDAGNVGQSGIVNVVVSTDAKISPNLIMPSNNEVFSENDAINFQWNSLIDAVSYELTVATDTTFANFIIQQTIEDTSFVANSLSPGAYFWRVRSLNSNNQNSAWSEYLLFSKGNLKWTITLDRGLSDWGNHIAETNDGGYVVVGPSYTDTTNMYQDIWLNKLDFSGNRVWENTFGDPEADYGNWVEQTSDGGYYIFGGHSENSRQMWLTRTDAQGNRLWEKKYGNPDSSSWGINASIIDNDNLLVCGNFENKSGMLYLDANGNTIWTKQIDFDSTSTYVSSIDVCSDGSIVGITRKYIFKIDQTGNVQWYKEMQLSENGRLRRVIQTNEGGFALVSYYDGIIMTDEFGNEQWRYVDDGNYYGIADKFGEGIVASGKTSNGNILLMARDYNNNLLWSKEYSSGISSTVITTNSGGFLLTGSTSRWGDLDSDVFVMKTDKNGNTVGNLGKASFTNRFFKNKTNSLVDPFGSR